MDNSWLVMIREMGLGVTLAMSTFIAFFFLLKWVLKAAEKMLDRMEDERKKAWDVMDSYQRALQDHTEQAKLFHESVNEAHKYQREEHKEMILTLGRINGYKEDHK